MVYYGYFSDINDTPYTVMITTPAAGSNTTITLTGDPVIINYSDGDLFTPIKPTSCTINILTDTALLDLYTTDPQGVMVKIYQRNNTNNVLFIGYVTPMNYGQDWTSKDTLTLECVDLLSSLKNIPYTIMNSYKGKAFCPADELIAHVLSHCDPNDMLGSSFRFYWPYINYFGINQKKTQGQQNLPMFSFSTTQAFLHAICFSEANFFDDDDEKTPWTFYQVLEEICRFFCVSAITYNKGIMFFDPLYAASTYNDYDNYEYDLDLNYELVHFYSKSKTLNNTDDPAKSYFEYAAGGAEIELDDYYNIINENTNRYNIDEICTDLTDHKKYHVSITKERNFGSGYQVWTITQEHFFTADEVTYKYAFKTFCYADAKSLWRHVYYRPKSFININPTMFFGNGLYYDGETYDLEVQNPHALGFYNIPENQWINTIGATFLHYATMTDETNKPTKLDWTDVIMFQCSHPTVATHYIRVNNQAVPNYGKIKYSDLFGDTNLERACLYYQGDEEICLSPSDGTSWININAKLWYQQNKRDGNKYLWVTKTYADKKDNIQTMFPIEDVTDWEPYPAQYIHTSTPTPGEEPADTIVQYTRKKYETGYGNGWSLLRCAVRVGYTDSNEIFHGKYWDGTQWTETQSTFYINFTSEYKGKSYSWSSGGQSYSDTRYDAFQYLTWMNCVSTSDYEDKVGAEGYCIPIQPSDAVKGKIEIYFYTPRMIPTQLYNSSFADDTWDWYKFGPIVFMKDLKIQYIYTDESEWYLNEEKHTDDLKYCNDTKDTYKYEKDDNLKIQSWQTARPIAKSYPIIDYTVGNAHYVEYVRKIYDQFHQYPQEQEYNIIDRKLRHYKEPRLIYKANVKGYKQPWYKYTIGQYSGIDLTKHFIINSQEYDVRNCNNRITLIEWGDVTI